MGHLIRKPLPGFSLRGYCRGESRVYSREDLLGRWAVLFFYPADFSFVCPTELQDLADHFAEFEAEDCSVFSVSTDSDLTHRAWAEADPRIGALPFVMLGDPEGTLCREYGVLLEEAGQALRATFVLDPAGEVVLYEIQELNIGRNAAELLRKLRAARFVSEHGDRLCPAAWQPGEPTLAPSLDLADLL